MCGISGIFNGSEKQILEFKSLSYLLDHRGPDSKGDFIDLDNKILLCHNRLAIQDLSNHGNQPMTSSNNRWIISFNGEIYNHKKLRKKLESCIWKGNSDTETLIEYISQYGIKNALENVEGMFAFAIWDKVEKKLILARDRFGEKPIYYSLINNVLIFASELKVISKFSHFNKNININSFIHFMNYSYTPKELSIYNDCYKLKSGTYLEFIYQNNSLIKKNDKYFDINKSFKTNYNNQLENQNDILQNLDILMNSSVKKMLISDVPVATMLSSGVDSSLVSYYAQKNSLHQINSFTLGFEDRENEVYDETKLSSNIAEYLGTKHYHEKISENSLVKNISLLTDIYSEPFADSSQIPSLILANLVSKHNKVVLTGDGADEIFGGYNRYFYAYKYFPILIKIPFYLRNILTKLISSNYKMAQYIFKFMNILMLKPKNTNYENFLLKFLIILKSNNIEEYFLNLKTNNYKNNFIFKDLNNIKYNFFDQSINDINNMMLDDQKNYLQGDILHKVDIATMSNSLESRLPFLDAELYEYAIKIPDKYKINSNQNKIILRKLLSTKFPDNLINKSKIGFSVPIGRLMNTSLNKWCEELLNTKNDFLNEIIDYNKLNLIWKKHKDGIFVNSHILWNIFVFKDWYLRTK
ncbi:MAG: asparagine synthase (glutamine-hydrolyzing) [Pelagibacteraceae bacterium]|nr:asparagine synthase (glutamine-hydrolyzing) [Pelagibacteraceae bacterium]